MSIATKVVSLNPAHGEVYLMHYVIVCQWLAAGRWFSLCTLLFSTNKTDHHDITEILLKVALNTITHPPPPSLSVVSTWTSTSLNLLGQKETTFFLCWTSSEFVILVRFQNSTWPLEPFVELDWQSFKALLFRNYLVVWNLIWCERSRLWFYKVCDFCAHRLSNTTTSTGYN